MEKMAGMDGSMSGMQHATSHGFVGEALGFTGALVRGVADRPYVRAGP